MQHHWRIRHCRAGRGRRRRSCGWRRWRCHALSRCIDARRNRCRTQAGTGGGCRRLPRLHEVGQGQRIGAAMLTRQQLRHLLQAIARVQVHGGSQDANHPDLLVNVALAPGVNLVGLDDVVAVEALAFGPPDDGLRMQQHGVVKAGLGTGPASDAQLVQHLGQHPFVAQALFQRRLNAKAPLAGVAHRELAVLVDLQLTIEALGLEEVEVQHAIDDEVVNLCHLAIHHQAQVVDDSMQLAVFVVGVDVVRGIALALHAALGAKPFVLEPAALVGRQQGRLLQIGQQRQSARPIVGLLDEHPVLPELVWFSGDSASHTQRYRLISTAPVM